MYLMYILCMYVYTKQFGMDMCTGSIEKIVLYNVQYIVRCTAHNLYR